MKRHKPKAHDWPRPCLCENCPLRGAQYSAGEFIDQCKADGTINVTPPAYCPYKPKEGESVCLK